MSNFNSNFNKNLLKLRHCDFLLGFLNAASYDPGRRRGAPANFGLMDCMAALKWVQGNVAAFGGDAARVTLAGHRAGAVVAHLLTSSPAVPPGNLKHNFNKNHTFQRNLKLKS